MISNYAVLREDDKGEVTGVIYQTLAYAKKVIREDSTPEVPLRLAIITIIGGIDD